MNDPELPELPDLPELSAAEEARIRALVAGAKHDEPMPEVVVARLDRVLAGLAEESTEQPALATVVPLAERRRRATRMLVAAAAVVVAGVGLGQVVSHQGGVLSDSSGGSAADAPERSSLGVGTDSKELSGGSAGAGAEPPQPQSDSLNGVSAYKVRPRHFAQDTRRVQSYSDSASTDTASNPRAFGCVRGHWGAGTYVPVEYGRSPAYLVLRRHTGDSQVADLFLCGSDAPVRSITLPGP
jgi:hypothetical protein